MSEAARVDLERSRRILQEKLLALMPGQGDYPLPLQGGTVHRYNGDGNPKPFIYRPVIIVVVQGKKWVKIGNEEHVYGEQSCFVAGVDMPAASCVTLASPDKPYLSISLELDKGLIAQLAAEVPPASFHSGHPSRGALVQDLEPELLDAFLRLTELIEKPEQAPVLGPLINKEIHFRLLTGPFGGLLRTLHTFGSRNNQIVKAISWLSKNFKKSMQVDTLAGQLNMATSTFHKHFKEVTSLSPLQYQKRLRLNEAQRLMLNNDLDATQASLAVGYESLTQFNREYKRLFGEPPRRDISRLR